MSVELSDGRRASFRFQLDEAIEVPGATRLGAMCRSLQF
jgi:hypothetical protein